MSYREEPPAATGLKPRGVTVYDHVMDNPAGVGVSIEEFNGVGLDPAWVVDEGIVCSPINPLNEANCGAGGVNAKYIDQPGDGFLKTQVSGGLAGNPNGRGYAHIRRPYTLAVGRSLWLKLFTTKNWRDISNSDDYFITLSNNTTEPDQGTRLQVDIETEQGAPGGVHIRHRTGGVISGGPQGGIHNVINYQEHGTGLYIRFMRLAGNTYMTEVGYNPRAMCPMRNTITFDSTLTQLWLADRSQTNVCLGSPYPVDMVEWIRESDNSPVPIF